MPEKEFIYRKPHEQLRNKERELGFHSLELFLEGRKVGKLNYNYFSGAMPTYYLDYLFTYPDYRGKGYGSELLEQINSFLKEKKRMGVLINAIGNLGPKTENTKDMYKRHGWVEWGRQKREDEYSFMVMYFNPPKWASKEEIDRMIKKVTKHEEEKERRKLEKEI